MKGLAPRYAQAFLAASFVVLLAVVLARASVMEDAYITFRVVDNVVNGFGLRWNLHERVQAYTNPLWLFAHVPFYVLYDDIVIDTLMVSLICTELAVCAALYTHRRPPLESALLFVLPLALSRSFTVYSTSGFENALGHALYAYFGWAVLCAAAQRRMLHVCLAVSLSMVNRLDTLLLYLPFIVLMLRTQRLRMLRWQVLAGLAPIIAWELFSLWYYGFLFPNTKYAKLNTGVAQWDYWQLGFSYLLNLFAVDFVSGVMIVAALCLLPSLVRRARTGDELSAQYAALVAGIGLYVLYVVQVGGTYLSGRLFSPCVFASAWVLLAQAWHYLRLEMLAKMVAMLALLTVCWPTHAEMKALCPLCFKGVDPVPAEVKDGLWDVVSGKTKVPEAGSLLVKERVMLEWSMGKWGWSLDRNVKVVDGFAIVDGLLARLPMDQPQIVTMGMTTRNPPRGYLQAVASGNLQGMDPDLAQYYDKLRILTQGDLWDAQRLVEIARFNMGAYDQSLKRYVAKKAK